MSYLGRETLRETRCRTYELFKVDAGGRIGCWLDYAIVLLIVANVVAVMLETVDPLYEAYGRQFYIFEAISVAVFTIEYTGRLWAATEHPEYEHWLWGRLRYAFSPFMVIDLIAILPFYLVAMGNMRMLRALRLLRFLRLLKLTRYSESLQLLKDAVRMKREELVITGFVGVVLLLLSSSMMYFAERVAQPEAFSSIPAALWWGVVTLTTVGYGDVHPVTTLGQAIGAIVAVIGVGLFALPASILASGLIEAARGETVSCPHCGKDISEEIVEDATE